MKNAKIGTLLAALAMVVWSGCSERQVTQEQGNTPQEQKQDTKTGGGEEKPGAAGQAQQAEFETGRAAFHRMYAQARLWAQDARPVKLESSPTPTASAQPGKATVWRGQFASPSRRGLRPYVWSGATGEDAPAKGVTQGTEDTFNPNNASTQPFDMQFLKVDTDKAFGVAQGKGGEKLLKQKADTPVMYMLDWDARKNALMWHVIYGASPGDARLHVLVDASTGNFVRTVK